MNHTIIAQETKAQFAKNALHPLFMGVKRISPIKKWVNSRERKGENTTFGVIGVEG